MITLRLTRKGLEVTKYLPFIFFGNKEGGISSLSDSPLPSIQKTEKEVEHERKIN